MPSAWVEHIKAFAKENGMSYKDALKDPKCKEEYHKGKEMTGGMVAEKENISMTITEKKPRGRPKKYATEEERKKAKSAKTIESNKRKKFEKLSAGAEKLEMAVPDMSVKPKGIVIKPRPAPVEKKTPFEEKAREAMIEYGFNEQEKFWDFHSITRWKSGKKKGQIRYTTMPTAKREEQEKWKVAEEARLAKKYGLPKKWNEALREMLGHGEVNDLGYIGQDKWWKTAGNKERHEAREELEGRGLVPSSEETKKQILDSVAYYTEPRMKIFNEAVKKQSKALGGKGLRQELSKATKASEALAQSVKGKGVLKDAIAKHAEVKEKGLELLPEPMKRKIKQARATEKLLKDNKAKILAEDMKTGSYGGGLIAGYKAEDAGGLTHIYPLSHAHILEMCKHLI